MLRWWRVTKLHEGKGQVNLGSEPHSLERRWTSMAPTRENRAEHLGQTVDGTEAAADKTVAMAVIVSTLVSIATAAIVSLLVSFSSATDGALIWGGSTGEAPNIYIHTVGEDNHHHPSTRMEKSNKKMGQGGMCYLLNSYSPLSSIH